MQSPKTMPIVILPALATILAAANVWFAAARSTIPLRLDAVVQRKEVRHEKHPPRDDVCLLDLGPLGILHVDQSVFDRVSVGDHLRKERWTRTLECNQRKIELAWSVDTRGLIRVMPLACGIMAGLALALASYRILGGSRQNDTI